MSNSKIGYQAKVGYQVGDLVIVDNSSQRWCLVVLRRFVTTNRRTGSLLVQNTFFSTQDTSKEIYSTQQIYTMDLVMNSLHIHWRLSVIRLVVYDNRIFSWRDHYYSKAVDTTRSF